MGKAFMHRSVDNNNFYTHYSMTEQLLENEKFEGSILEPCCGEYSIAKVIKKYIFNTEYIDCFDKKYNDFNFLDFDLKYDNIITNPPYGRDIDLFVLKAKKLYKKKIAFLMRTNWLSGSKRYNLAVYDELARIYIFTRMADLRAPLRNDGKYPTAGIVYAWYIWVKGWQKEPIVRWINNQKYVLKKGE